MDYKTFTNELEKNTIVEEKEKDENMYKQCIVCLEKTPINGKDIVTLMNDMHFLNKKCDCLCYAHHKCLETWIGVNAVCPICKGEISFPKFANKNKEFTLEIPGNYIVQSNTVSENNIESSHFCIRMTFLVFFILTILQILFYN